MRLPSPGLLRDHDFRGLFISTTFSQVGFHMMMLGLPLVAVLALAASPFEVGLLVSLQMAAFLLIGLPAGAWVDRMRRRAVLIVSDFGRAALLVSVPVAWWLDLLTIWQLYAVALFLGVFTVFFDVAYQSYLPHLVGRENLVEANAKLESVRAVAQLAGPALAGQLMRLLSAPVALLANAIAMALSAFFVVAIRKREERPARRPDAKLLREIGEGLRFVLGHPLLRPIAIGTGMANLFIAAYQPMAIVFLERELGLGAGAIGTIFSVVGAGALLGAFLARRVAGRLGQGPAIWISIAVTAPLTLLLPLADSTWQLLVGVLGWFGFAAGSVIYNVVQVSFRQAVTPDRLLGRMNATMRFLVWGTVPLGGLLGGGLGQLFGPRNALFIAGVGLMLAFLPLLLSPLRGQRRLPEQPDEPAEVARAG